jgi:hypothetical protein
MHIEQSAYRLATGLLVPGAVLDARILDRATEIIQQGLARGYWSKLEKKHYVWPRLCAIKAQRELVAQQAARRQSRARGYLTVA